MRITSNNTESHAAPSIILFIAWVVKLAGNKQGCNFSVIFVGCE